MQLSKDIIGYEEEEKEEVHSFGCGNQECSCEGNSEMFPVQEDTEYENSLFQKDHSGKEGENPLQTMRDSAVGQQQTIRNIKEKNSNNTKDR